MEEAQSYAEENNCVFYETSAKTGQNIHEIFRAIAEKLPTEPQPSDRDGGSIEIIPDNGDTGGCCKS
eukprot:TRINITY_DN3137_c0_g1_i1.p2 TRINITY_DN3137_c0_g1~~TRINITY_DN3137_c0_g1_i1.p2  ORF type:complete len:67 (-),score=15.22 TRINITY_DN3137_c0_g1_i1:82-282(-)